MGIVQSDLLFSLGDFGARALLFTCFTTLIRKFPLFPVSFPQYFVSSSIDVHTVLMGFCCIMGLL